MAVTQPACLDDNINRNLPDIRVCAYCFHQQLHYLQQTHLCELPKTDSCMLHCQAIISITLKAAALGNIKTAQVSFGTEMSVLEHAK